MKKSGILNVFFLILSVLFISCGSTGSAQGKIPLNDGWEYSLTDPFVMEDFKPLEKNMLSELENIVPDKKGFIWLRKTFVLPSYLRGKDLGCFMGRITFADETWVNKVMIGKTGSFPPHEFSAWNKSRCYNLPKAILEQDAANTLLLKIWVDGEGSISSDLFISTIEEANIKASQSNFWNCRLQLVFAFMMLVIGLYYAFIYFKYPTEKEHLTFGLINLLSSLYLSVFYYTEIPGFMDAKFSWLIYQKIFSSAMVYVFPFLVTTYINSFIKRHEKPVVLAVRLAFMFIPVILVMCCPTYYMLHRLHAKLQLMLVPPMIYILCILIASVIQKKRETFQLLTGFSPLVISVILDIFIHGLLKVSDFPYVSSMGWQLVIVTLLFVMANRFANSRIQVEDLNKNLEKKVADRTKDLAESNDKLLKTNEELSVTNENLNEANAKLNEAKIKADRDMRLAVNVQNSFYQRLIPNLEGWDLSYSFNPAAGVSGDLYDFFYSGSKFLGMGLFDVSGHGISSGLVTMLAKTVIDRQFMQGLSLPFSQVMGKINRSIVEEKGDIENYLTGVLLRVSGSKVEFINAGHPKVFYRSAKTGKVVSVEISEAAENEALYSGGGIIGIAGMEPDFKTITFNMKSGDCLLLYTDCLSESRNAAGEEYGYEKIKAALAKASGPGAKAKMDCVLQDFREYTKGTELKDDLTLIVLQKK